MRSLFLIMFAFFLSFQAAEAYGKEVLPLPRMASLRSNYINGRAGPGEKYPIEWIYKQKGAPVEIVNEFDVWRKVKDWEGSESWVHETRLNGRRFVKVIVPGENNIYNSDKYHSKVIAKVEDGVIGEIKECRKGSDFCLIKFDTIEGWVPRKILFGVYENEIIN